MFDEYTLFFVPQKVGISYKVKKGGGLEPRPQHKENFISSVYNIIIR